MAGFFDGSENVDAGVTRLDALVGAEFTVRIDRHVLIDKMQKGKHAGQPAIVVEMTVEDVTPIEGQQAGFSAGSRGSAFFRLPPQDTTVGKTLWRGAMDHFRALLNLKSGESIPSAQLEMLFKPTPEQQKQLLEAGIPFGPEAFAGTRMKLRSLAAKSATGTPYIARTWTLLPKAI